MADWAKIAIKAGLVAILIGLVIAVCALIPLPTVNWTPLVNGLNKGLAVLNHYCPAIMPLWYIWLGLLTLELTFYTLYWGEQAVKWIMKVNE